MRQETTNIDANFERKKKQVEIAKKMYVKLLRASAPPPSLLVRDDKLMVSAPA